MEVLKHVKKLLIPWVEVGTSASDVITQALDLITTLDAEF